MGLILKKTLEKMTAQSVEPLKKSNRYKSKTKKLKKHKLVLLEALIAIKLRKERRLKH